MLITRGVFNPRRHNVLAMHLTKVAKEHFHEKFAIHKKKYPNPKKVRTPHFKLDFWKNLFEVMFHDAFVCLFVCLSVCLLNACKAYTPKCVLLLFAQHHAGCEKRM